MFEPVYEFPKQPRNAGKIFGISGLKVALNFGSLRQMKQIEFFPRMVAVMFLRSSKIQPPQPVPSG